MIKFTSCKVFAKGVPVLQVRFVWFFGSFHFCPLQNSEQISVQFREREPRKVIFWVSIFDRNGIFTYSAQKRFTIDKEQKWSRLCWDSQVKILNFNLFLFCKTSPATRLTRAQLSCLHLPFYKQTPEEPFSAVFYNDSLKCSSHVGVTCQTK